MDVFSEVGQDKVFWLKDSSILKSLVELKDRLDFMPDDIFFFHANSEKNDFYNWVKDIYQNQSLANKIKNAKTRQELKILLEKELKPKIEIKKVVETLGNSSNFRRTGKFAKANFRFPRNKVSEDAQKPKVFDKPLKKARKIIIKAKKQERIPKKIFKTQENQRFSGRRKSKGFSRENKIKHLEVAPTKDIIKIQDNIQKKELVSLVDIPKPRTNLFSPAAIFTAVLVLTVTLAVSNLTKFNQITGYAVAESSSGSGISILITALFLLGTMAALVKHRNSNIQDERRFK